jgi:hypothetical protein
MGQKASYANGSSTSWVDDVAEVIPKMERMRKRSQLFYNVALCATLVGAGIGVLTSTLYISQVIVPTCREKAATVQEQQTLISNAISGSIPDVRFVTFVPEIPTLRHRNSYRARANYVPTSGCQILVSGEKQFIPNTEEPFSDSVTHALFWVLLLNVFGSLTIRLLWRAKAWDQSAHDIAWGLDKSHHGWS